MAAPRHTPQRRGRRGQRRCSRSDPAAGSSTRSSAIGPPFFKPVWFRDIVGLVLPADPAAVDWDEVAELVTESYRLLAPKRLTP